MVGVREATGNNDGPEVEMWLRHAKVPKGSPYCAAFVHFYLDACGVPNTITAWSPTAENKNALCWKLGRLLREPQQADVFTIWNVARGRIAHTGFYVRRINHSFFETIEGNTNPGGSRDGDGVYRRKRSYRQTYSISSWIN